MLVLKNIKKNYSGNGFSQNALDDISVSFRKNEFVAILGPSGSGKTTMLNIIGGLDHYTDGDLIINGKSTKKFTDGDWDTYRNHSIGFVFQSYNLIPHQSVLANVELALTLSGVSRKERRERAKEALRQVGLGDQISKKPNQMSGGQMQRVAIARALVNNPDILLADEPTGALDSNTSVQIMELLKEVSKDKLVIMVTHNPELADSYANRIIRVKDGKIVDDTNPYNEKEELNLSKKKIKKPSMSLFTALSLSLNNLMTKKARTFLTSFAGSIGIIGIALILSLSSGIKAYINQVQEDTLSSYPIEIEAEQIDMSSLISGIMGANEESANHGHDKVYSNSVMYELSNSFNTADTKTNDLKALKTYFESGTSGIENYARAIQYKYDVPLYIYSKTSEDKYQKADIMEVFSGMYSSSMTSSSSAMASSFSSYNVWDEILPDMSGEGISDVITSQYELVAGQWPKDKEDIILVLDKNNEITDITLQALGLKTTEEIVSDMASASKGEEVEISSASYSYDELLGRKFKLICASDTYTKNDDGIWTSIEDDESSMDVIISNGLELNIVGIIRPTEDSNTSAISSSSSLLYTKALTNYIIERTNNSEIVKEQSSSENENYDVFTGLPFVLEEETKITNAEKANELKEYFSTLSESEKAEMYKKVLSVPDSEQLEKTVEEYMAKYPDRKSLEDMIFSTYAQSSGLDEDTIRTYIEKYDDDELREMVEDKIRETVKAQTEKAAESTIADIKSEPTNSELAPYKKQITSKLTDRNTKIMYIVSEYTKSTKLPQETILTYLMTADDATIDSMVDELAETAAKEIYAQYHSTDDESSNIKVATAFDAYIKGLSEDKLASLYEECMPPKSSDSTLKDNYDKLGVADGESPSSICIYTSTFADKDSVADIIENYNNSVEDEKQISYTDYVGLIMSSVTTIINAISYVLIAFVSISLVVSSIMIGIITYISVLERTKEIGILRAIGASKKDISRVFNAETLIEGFVSGALGIGITVALCFPINAIIRSLSGIETLTAYLPLAGGIALLLISMLLTFIAGLVPSKIAAKKDPVVALRTE